MKKETLKDKIKDLTILYSTAREEGDDEEHERVVEQILELFEAEKKKWFKELKFKERIEVASQLGALKEKLK